MKKIKYLSIIFCSTLLAFVQQSCTDLEPKLYSQIDQTDYESDPELAFDGKFGDVYVNLQREYGYVYREGFWSLQENTTDECIVPTRWAGDWYDSGNFWKLHNHMFTSTLREIAANGKSGYNAWNFCYTGITKCNSMIQWMDKVNANRPRERAELVIFRCFYHYLLLDNFGNIPYVSKTSDTYTPVQSTRAQAFDSIMTDMLANLQTVREDKVYARINKSVGWMIMAKMYLNAEAWGVVGHAQYAPTAAQCYAKAALYCDSIISKGLYSLEPDYKTNFLVKNEGSTENMWNVVYDAALSKGMQFHMMTLHYKSKETFNLKNTPWNGYCTTHKFIGIYDSNDIRLNETWLRGQQYSKAGSLLTAEVAVDSATYRLMPNYVRKPVGYPASNPGSNPVTLSFPVYFTDTITTLTNKPGSLGGKDNKMLNVFQGARFRKFEYEENVGDHMSNDFPIFRYADVLLMKGEALMRANGGVATTEALNAINQVRTRANATAYDASLTLDELLMERGRELCWEGFRRQDLIRFGRFTGVNSLSNEADPYNLWILKNINDGSGAPLEETPDYKKIFPLPDFAVDGGYTQNPGY